MWKRDEQPGAPNVATPVASTQSRVEKNDSANAMAVIGKSIRVKGEVTGSEDLVIEGCVEGTIELKQNAVVVGKGGRVTANITGKVIQVYGEVTGDLSGTEQIVIHESGSVRGNVTAPRVSLKDGARLKGAINTEHEAARAQAAAKPVESSAKPSANGAKSTASMGAHL